MAATYALKPAAEKALKDERARLLRLRAYGLITTEYALRTIRAFARDLYANALTDARDIGHIGTECPMCKRVHVMASDVTHYRCHCTPHVERATFRHRVPLV